jgi:pantoate--beta-alanine ligase
VENVISNIAELEQIVHSLKSAGKSIGVVPTMGALHRGHLSLVEQSLRQSDATIVTIFVNPTQFAPGEDLNKYPQTLESDLEKLAGLGDVRVFAPTVAEMYPEGFSTTLNPPKIAGLLEGESRPSHFGGVATIVLKLLNLTSADLAFFGQKDFQQQLVVRRMVQDLNVPTQVCVCPIVRAADGLALSSRNVFLSTAERAISLTLNRTLSWAEKQIREGQRDGFELIVEMRQRLIDGGVTSVDYVAIADPDTLETIQQIQFPLVAMVAAYVGKTRLIDNVVIESPSPSP